MTFLRALIPLRMGEDEMSGQISSPRIDWGRFGRAVSDVRCANGFGLREQARELGLSHATLHRAENGKAVSPAAFIMLCAFAVTDPYKFLKRCTPSPTHGDDE